MGIAAVFLAVFSAVPSFREKLTAAWRRRRGDKGVARKMNDARLAQALAMGMASGMPVEEAVELAAGLMEETPAAKARCLDCRARLDGGETTSAAMEKISAGLSEESEAALEDQVSRVEPALVLVCSILVGLILLSVMLPLMHIMSAIG